MGKPKQRYQRQAKLYELTFDEESGDLAGLWAAVRGTSMGGLIKIIRLADREDEGDMAGALEQLADAFGGLLQDWTMDDEQGTAVPPTTEGLLSLEPAQFQSIVGAYLRAVRGVSVPLGDGSNSGEPSLAASIPMDVLSPSPES